MDDFSVFTPRDRCPVQYSGMITAEDAPPEEPGMRVPRFCHRKTCCMDSHPDTLIKRSADNLQKLEISEELNLSLKRLKQHSSKGERQAGLLVRFNKDDTLTEVFWSEKYRPMEGCIKLGFQREDITDIGSITNGFKLKRSQPVLGGHREAIFIRSWGAIIKYGEFYPKAVDIFLTFSPCLNHSTGYLDSCKHFWPPGCAPKLYKLITEKKDVDHWNIIYFSIYGHKSEGPAMQAILKLKKLPKVTVFNYDPDRDDSLMLL